MENLKMHTPDLAEENYRKLAELFPNAVTETITGYDEDGKAIIERAIDADVLRQEIAAQVVEGSQERYQFTWPDKKRSVVLANQPIAKTLRLVREKSVGRDGTPGSIDTKNIYIEGDNLDALKLLQETYLGKVRMIYIDPPYNTGSDFIYEDDFSQETTEYIPGSGQLDDDGNRLVQNLEGNGRFHTDWLNMLYPRLRIAKDFLSDDGAIFISIDDNEIRNLRMICDEVFGAGNFVSTIVWQKIHSTKNDARYFSENHEYALVYAKSIGQFSLHLLPRTDDMNSRYKNPDNDPRGPWKADNFTAPGYRPNQMYEITLPSGRVVTPPEGRCWRVTKEGFERFKQEGKMIYGNNGDGAPAVKRFLSEMPGMVPWTWLDSNTAGHTQEGNKLLVSIMGGVVFDYPKPERLIHYFLEVATDQDSIVLDSFAGSGTTAHAVLNLNKEDGGHRKFILVELGDYADSITAERVRRVINGYGEEKSAVHGVGGDFSFYELGEPLFCEDGSLNRNVPVEKVREYIWFMETRETYNPQDGDSYYLGSMNGAAYYFFYNPEEEITLT